MVCSSVVEQLYSMDKVLVWSPQHWIKTNTEKEGSWEWKEQFLRKLQLQTYNTKYTEEQLTEIKE